MKVWIAVHGRFHAFELANELYRHNVLNGVATTYPTRIARRWLPADVSIESAALLELIRRFRDRVPIGPESDAYIAEHFGKFAARRIPSDTDVVITWSAASLETITAAQARGIPSILERGSTHIEHQINVVREAYERAGMIYKRTDQRIIDRELAEYESSDRIAVPTEFTAQTFTERGISPDKIIVNPYGVTINAGSERRRSQDAPVRILFVGGVGPRKGVPTLLDAFSRLTQSAELVLAGPVEPGMEDLLAGRLTQSISVLGAVSADRIAEEMADADIFCLPSVEEGLSLALLQALGAGLPIVTTAESGAEDVIENGREGYIVPAHDPAALTERLDHLVGNPSLRRTMASAASQRVTSGFSWSDYGVRAVKAYRKLLSG